MNLTVSNFTCVVHIALKSVILSIHSSDMFILRPKSTAKKF